MPNQKLSKSSNQDTSQAMFKVSSLSIFFQIYTDFQINIVKWEHLVVNCQWLTPQLTITFFQSTHSLAIQNNFGMSFLDKFNQWNKLNTKNQRANRMEIKFPLVNRKIREKDYSHVHLFYQ